MKRHERTLAEMRAICERSNDLRILWNGVLVAGRFYILHLGDTLGDMAEIGQVRARTSADRYAARTEFAARSRILFAKLDEMKIAHPDEINILELCAQFNGLKWPKQK
jgi:hypothetical protein